MSFSTGLRITNIDDFITPAQECIKPVKREKSKNTARIILEYDGSFTGITETGEKYTMEKAEISLNDCLACSGCVTSAETILINEQSTDEFLKKIKLIREHSDNALIVMSISPQSKASLSTKFKLGNAYETHAKLRSFFKSISVDALLDTTFGREFSLVEMARDVKSKIQSKLTNSPLLTSSCPGWVCYAEKHKENKLLVPLISRVKSPQQMMGYLVKHHLPERYDHYRNTDVLHVTVMPCFDKKLEASRDEFSFHRAGSADPERDVDIVLSTLEIEQLIADLRYDFHTADVSQHESHEVEEIFSCKNAEGENCFYSHEGTGSGGYLEFALRYCAKELFDIDLKEVLSDDRRVRFKPLRNSDFEEVSLVSETGGTEERLLSFAYAYGFRNIQTVVQKIRQKRCDYQLIEVMACPGGCLNGGGQIRSDENQEQQKVMLQCVTDNYQSSVKQRPLVNANVTHIYEQLRDLECLSTTYNVVPKIDIINPASFKW